MIDVAVRLALFMLTAALVLNLWRLLRGPDLVDRILALDTMYVNTVALLVVIGIARRTMLYFEAAVVIALLGFLGTVALCRFALRRRLME